ncbi:coiled-coil protein [Methanocrinis sp.]|uniref:coiled-coil protein n=1 Tax=Methanocrinis sp. TaxID=3101522 RepID=UPI003D13B448
MLAELEEKKARLKQQAVDFKESRSQLNAEASKWAAERNELNKKTKELIDKAQELKKLRDEYNKSVAEAKQNRDEYNEKTNDIYAQIDEIRKKHNLTGDRSIRGLRREIDHMEFKQQTEVLSPEKEKQLVERISALRTEFKTRKEQMEKNEVLRDLLDGAQELRDKASEYHDLVTKSAELAQEYHDKMIATFKEADQMRAQADAAHREFVTAQEAADKQHREFIRTQREIRDFDKIITGLRRKNREKREDKVKAEVRKEAEEILTQFRQGEKLDTSDLLRLQRSGLV